VFAIDSSGAAHAAGTILMSSWSGGNWSPWSVAVGAPAAGQTRCYLSGFDRVVLGSNDTVGLVWTEAAQNCATTTSTSLWTAIVPVP
jgi:hypothetical protein